MNIISQVLQQVTSDKFYGVSNSIEICKGKYKIPTNKKEKLEKIKRRMLFLLKK